MGGHSHSSTSGQGSEGVSRSLLPLENIGHLFGPPLIEDDYVLTDAAPHGSLLDNLKMWDKDT